MSDYNSLKGQTMASQSYATQGLGVASSLNIVQPPPTIVERLVTANARLASVEKTLSDVLNRVRGAVPEDGCASGAPTPHVLSVLERINQQQQLIEAIEALVGQADRLI